MASPLPVHIPPLVDASRRNAFILLVAITVGEALAQVAATGALKALLVGVTGGSEAIVLLATTGVAAAVMKWSRDTAGERFGLNYANQVRRSLGQQALAVASRGGPGRFGTIAIRMTGDLSALKDWARDGVCGGIAGLLGLLGAIIAAWWTAGLTGLTATMVGPVVTLLTISLLVAPLHTVIRTRRRHKGRLSARIGDMLLGASASTAYAAEQSAIDVMDRAARDALSAQTRQVAVANLMKAPALLTLPLGAAMAVFLQSRGLSPTGGAAGWAALLFALSLASIACSQMIAAAIHFAERRIAMAKLVELVELANQSKPVTPRGSDRLKTGTGLSLHWHDTPLIIANKHRIVARADATAWLDAVLSADKEISVDGKPAAEIRSIDWARRVAYAGSSRGLVRGRLDQVLAARRRAPLPAMRAALQLVGLPDDWITQNPVIDPQSTKITADVLARLRLARALAHGPRVLIVDDPWLSQDEALMQRVSGWCADRKVSLMEIVADTCGPADLRTAP